MPYPEVVNRYIRVMTCFAGFGICYHVPGPLDAANASSPMKKSKSSVPRFAERCPLGPAPPVRNEGLFATAGLPDPDPAGPPPAPLVAMAVGNTKDGESLPAKPERGDRFVSRRKELLSLWKIIDLVSSIQCR
jgi:hypothetical protein